MGGTYDQRLRDAADNDPQAPMSALRAGGNLSLPDDHERNLSSLWPGLQSRRSGLLHRGDVCQLRARHPFDHAGASDCVSYRLALVAIPSGDGGDARVRTVDPLDLAVFQGHLDPFRPVHRPRRELRVEASPARQRLAMAFWAGLVADARTRSRRARVV